MKSLSVDQALPVVRFQIAYLARKTVRVPEGYMDKLYENIRSLKLDRRLEEELIAAMIVARRSRPAHREDLAGRALDALDCIFGKG